MKNQKRIIITVLLVVEVISIFLTWKSYNAGKILEDKVENNVTNEHFAFYIKENGVYKEQTGSTFPIGYHIDIDKTICVDESQEKLNDIPIQMDSNGNITVTSNRTVYCTFYLYGQTIGDQIVEKSMGQENFKKIEDNNNSLEYRFYGVFEDNRTMNNFICFGTSLRSECVANDYQYMYRIIGVTNDGKLKLRKDTFLGPMEWHDDAQQDARWDKGDNIVSAKLFEKLNGNEFLKNGDYIPNGWADKIEDTYWDIGDVTENTATTLHVADILKEEKSLKSTAASKIGLLYLSDFFYAIDGRGDSEQCFDNGWCSSWLWTKTNQALMTRMGQYNNNGIYNVYYILGASAKVFYEALSTMEFEVYPVFYTKNNLSISDSGTGTYNDPFIISE